MARVEQQLDGPGDSRVETVAEHAGFDAEQARRRVPATARALR